MRVYFDNKGRIREFYPQPIFATSDKVDKLEAYADFDITGFEPSLTIKRADGESWDRSRCSRRSTSRAGRIITMSFPKSMLGLPVKLR